MRFLTTFHLLLLVLAVNSNQAQAQTHYGMRGGFYLDSDALFLGGHLTHPIAKRWCANPNLEIAFVEAGSLFSINGDFLYDFPVRQSPRWYAGGGLAISHWSYREVSDTDIGLNGIFGARFGRSKTLPFAFVKLLLFAHSEFVIGGGVTF